MSENTKKKKSTKSLNERISGFFSKKIDDATKSGLLGSKAKAAARKKNSKNNA